MRYPFRPVSIGLVVTALVMSLGCEGEELTTASTSLLKRGQPVKSTLLNGGVATSSLQTTRSTPLPTASASVEPSADPEATASAEVPPEGIGDPTLDATPDPGPNPTPTPQGTPTPTTPPAPTPTPSPLIQPTVSRVVVSPNALTLNAQALGNSAGDYPSSARLAATVIMSDGTTHDHVSWTSSNPAQAMVTADGTVTVPSTATSGEVVVTAKAEGSSLTGQATVTVTSNGRLKVIVE